MDRFHESPIDAEQAEQHSSEALASTSNVEIEAPNEPDQLNAIRDELLALIKEQRPDWHASAIDDEPAIGIETEESGEFFIEVQNA